MHVIERLTYILLHTLGSSGDGVVKWAGDSNPGLTTLFSDIHHTSASKCDETLMKIRMRTLVYYVYDRCIVDLHKTKQGFFSLFWEHGPWRLNWEFRGVLLKIGKF